MQSARARPVHAAVAEDSEEATSQLNSVVELMLDITESSVAFCWELGAGLYLTYAQTYSEAFLVNGAAYPR